jgi:hypothetical protein
MTSRRSLKESWRARKDRPILSWMKKRKRSKHDSTIQGKNILKSETKAAVSKNQ